MIINYKYSNRRAAVGTPPGTANVVAYGFQSLGVAFVPPVMQPVVDTANFPMPVNCVLIGGQTENKKAIGLEGISGSMKAVFGES